MDSAYYKSAQKIPIDIRYYIDNCDEDPEDVDRSAKMCWAIQYYPRDIRWAKVSVSMVERVDPKQYDCLTPSDLGDRQSNQVPKQFRYRSSHYEWNLMARHTPSSEVFPCDIRTGYEVIVTTMLSNLMLEPEE